MDVLISKVDIADTVTRLKKLTLMRPEAAHPPIRVLSYTRLMDHSVEHIESMAKSDEPEAALVASRILESARTFSHWEHEHATVMQRVALRRRSSQQALELLSATFELIHRRGLFAHLRDNQVRGSRREHLVQRFFHQQGYARGLIAEHGNFLRSSASLACTSHVGADLFHDAVFAQPLRDYEQLYRAYFDAHCEWITAPDAGEDSGISESMIYSLKCDLAILRRTLIGLANRISMHEAETIPAFISMA